MESSKRRADYAFSIDPNFEQVKFFVEAKKPSRNSAGWITFKAMNEMQSILLLN